MKKFTKKQIVEIINNTPDLIKNKTIFDFEINYIGKYVGDELVEVGYFIYNSTTYLSVFKFGCVVKNTKCLK
ncbi:MAG: hypothetical protein KBT03_09355 [Bacteroidales bacterium]|nr:hypothetical protein [Candidatus Scybalousia scybalohippi]